MSGSNKNQRIMKLYKYQSVNVNSIASLVNEYVWFSSPNDLNDTLDLSLIDSEFLRSINYSKEKIYCLSSINDNPLMWSHYTDSHKGFCIEFTDFSNQEIDELKHRGIYPKDAPYERLTTIRNAKQVEYKTTEEIDQYIKSIPLKESDFMQYYAQQKALGLEKERGCSRLANMLGYWNEDKSLQVIEERSAQAA
jgi:hypothetical protein